jgi:hypothetical protein
MDQPEPDLPKDENISEEDKLLYKPIVETLYPLCWKLLTAAPNSTLRVSVLKAVLRMTYSAEADMLRKMLEEKDCG